MAGVASKAVKIINSGYAQRYRRKSAKGLGIYALQPKGAGPNGVHDAARGATCRCGGCSGRQS